MLSEPDAVWRLVNTRNGTILADVLEGAFDSQTRNRGLLGRSGLPSDRALVLAPCWGVHTFFMKFPIDIAFVDRSGKVLKLVHRLGPWRIRAMPRAFGVIEFSADALASSDTRRSDLLALCR